MKNIVPFIVFFIFFASCNNHTDDKSEKDCYKLFDVEASGKKNVQIGSLNLERIQLDSNIVTSFSGKIRYRNDTIFYADYRFCFIYAFDKEGRFLTRNLGSGQGPKELPTGRIDLYQIMDNSSHFVIGSSYDLNVYSNDFLLVNRSFFDFKLDAGSEERVLKDNPNHNERGLYDMNDGQEYYNCKIYDGIVYLPIYSMHPNFNYLTNDYYKYGRAMAKVNLSTGEVLKQMGRRSPVFLNTNYSVLDFYCFDITKKGELLLNFPPDSLIYVADLDFNIKRAFGRAGKNMDMNYTQITNIKKEAEVWKHDIKHKGFYNYIEYFDEQGLLFRSYTKGGDSPTDGLQIYRNEVLIADVDVPKTMRVEGYIEPYFYSGEIFDEDNEKMYVYRFPKFRMEASL